MKEIDQDWHPKARADVLSESVEDEMVIIVAGTEQVHLLNLTAAAIYELCDGSMSAKDIVTTIRESLDNPPEEIEDEIYKALSEFVEKGLLE